LRSETAERRGEGARQKVVFHGRALHLWPYR
jgi:hypothetical protein